MKEYIEKVKNNESLTMEQMKRAAEAIFNEETPASIIEQFLRALSEKGETADELAALAIVMKENAYSLHETPQSYLDNCGTGGDGIGSFNISTAAAFVLAAGDVYVAKHGNRKVSSLAGSTDTLEELGIHANFTHAQLKQLLDEQKLAFIFAPSIHPKLKRIGRIRQKIGKPTIFNLVGPLANPVALPTQYTGINRPEFVVEYAKVMRLLQRERAVVVSGEQGMDEASLSGINRLAILENNQITQMTLTAEDVGLQTYPLSAIKGGNSRENAQLIHRVLQNEQGAYLDTVLLNAGIGFFANGKTTTIQEGVHLAQQLIASGKAYEKLRAIIAFSKNYEKEHA
ncbi:anthranilate phosphoribosyltransferase [Kurthia senegalensis]|uniref:anthranilate phosphoribosyltransferase n=1 Tax=Kurthia senegalensis TaxID=1033740 RepID=UPI0002891469|nr:anthranilate phosphoribosyltransferase [Kurthia senegalensis]